MSGFFKSYQIISNTVNLLQNINNNDNNKIELLEPLSCIIELALLKYKPCGTKISLSDHRIHLQTPDTMQSAIRWYNGDKKNDLHNLYIPIRRACEWYLYENPTQEIKNIFEKAIHGLNNLKITYNENPLIVQCIYYYIGIIEKHDMVKEEIPTNHDLCKKLRELWSKEDIDFCCFILDKLDKSTDEHDKNSLISCLYCYLQPINRKFCSIISQFSTSL